MQIFVENSCLKKRGKKYLFIVAYMSINLSGKAEKTQKSSYPWEAGEHNI